LDYKSKEDKRSGLQIHSDEGNKADEDHVNAALNKMLLKLKQPLESSSIIMNLDILIQAVSTRSVLPQNAANLLTKIIAACKKSAEPGLLLGKVESILQEKREFYNEHDTSGKLLKANFTESLLHMSFLLEQETRQFNIPQPAKTEFLWNNSKEAFIQTFAPLLKNRTIQQPGKKDMAPLIRSLSELFKIEKARGEGYLEAASIQSYLKEALSEQYVTMS